MPVIIAHVLKKLEDPQYDKESSTSALIGHKLNSREIVAAEYGLSKNTVARLLRIDHLIVELKKRVDDGEIGIYPAVSLSYLTKEEQLLVEDTLANNEFKVDMKKAELLRSYSGKLTPEQAAKILSGEATRKPRSKSPAPFKLKHKVYAKYFAPDTKASEVEQIIDKALEMYFSYQRQSVQTEEDEHVNEISKP